MNAMPALKISPDSLPQFKKEPRRTAAKVSAKVINLKQPRRARGLSHAQREGLVLEYRPKARKLARSILRKWHARLDLEEVDSVVDLSLCEAVQRFNPNKGAAFMTFFFYHLRGNLIRAVSTAANAHSVPLPEAELMDRAHQHDERVGASRGGSAIEVAAALCGHEAPMPDELLQRKQIAMLSARACEKLDSLEREVIQRVFTEEEQLMDVAQTLGYSRCHISRVKRKALEALYHELRGSIGLEGALPQFNPGDEAEEESSDLRRELGRRVVQRRRPRAGRQHSLTAGRIAILEASQVATA